jgi:protein ImuB
MPRIAFVWLPAWPIDRLARERPGAVPAERPFALVDTGVCGLTIHAANAAALAAGVRIGATLADTRAALPTIVVRPAEPARDAAALARLAYWLGRYGPSRNVEGADGAWIDVTGVAHLFGGEAGLATDLVARLARGGIGARIGLADTHRGARALARFATTQSSTVAIAASGRVREAIAALSVAALDLAPETIDLMRRLGLARIGDVAGLPRAALARRFRDGLGGARRRGGARAEEVAATAVLLRLDQALGLTADPRRPMIEPPAAEVRLDCPEPLLTATGIEAALADLSVRLAGVLSTAGLAARDFALFLYRADGTVARAAVATGTPCREAAHIDRLLSERLEGLDAGFGVDLVVLAADRLEPWAPGAPTLAGARQDRIAAEAGRFVDRLSTRLGVTRVRRIVPVASHVPENAAKRMPALEDVPFAVGPATHGPRPPVLVEPPEPAEVVAEVPDGAPARLRWRSVPRRIVKAEGPERIAPEWWRALSRPEAHRPRTRDYWRLEDDRGSGYWVFREGVWGIDAVPAAADPDTIRDARGGVEADGTDGGHVFSAEPSPDGIAKAADPGVAELHTAGATVPGTAPRWFVHGVFA